MKYHSKMGKIPPEKIPHSVVFSKAGAAGKFKELDADLEACEGLALLLGGPTRTTLSARFEREQDAMWFALKWDR